MLVDVKRDKHGTAALRFLAVDEDADVRHSRRFASPPISAAESRFRFDTARHIGIAKRGAFPGSHSYNIIYARQYFAFNTFTFLSR